MKIIMKAIKFMFQTIETNTKTKLLVKLEAMHLGMYIKNTYISIPLAFSVNFTLTKMKENLPSNAPNECPEI